MLLMKDNYSNKHPTIHTTYSLQCQQCLTSLLLHSIHLEVLKQMYRLTQ
jgi:hypothetical protein